MAVEPLASFLKTAKLPHKLVAPNTACWRGYTSKWAVDNKKLFLVDWQGYILDCQKVGIEYLFPEEEIVFAKWFTGQISLAMGEMIKYVHGGYASVYEGEMILLLEKGELVKEHVKWPSQEEIERKRKQDEDLEF